MFDPSLIGFVDYRLLCPELASLARQFNRVREEYLAAKDALKWAPLHWDMGYAGSKDTGTDVGWNTALIMGDVFTDEDRTGWAQKGLSSRREGVTSVFENAAHLPTLTRILQQNGLTTRAALTRLAAHATLPWHRDWDPSPNGTAVIRVLWGLDVPDDAEGECVMDIRLGSGAVQRQAFGNNRAFMFWSQCEHQVLNTRAHPRTVIGLDIIQPIAHIAQALQQARRDAQGILHLQLT